MTNVTTILNISYPKKKKNKKKRKEKRKGRFKLNYPLTQLHQKTLSPNDSCVDQHKRQARKRQISAPVHNHSY